MKFGEKWFGGAAFFLPFALYIATLCPTVHLGDSGELNLAAATLGIPHVPGYPLLVTLGHAFCRLPFGNGAMRGNLFSAFFGALACFMFYRMLLWKFKRPVMAFAFALCLAGSFSLWEQSLKIRAYPLNTFFAISIIYLTLLWRENHDRRFLLALAFTLGLGLSNHEILLVVAAVPFVAFVADYKHLRVADLAMGCLLGLAGLSVYGYLPIRAQADPVLNWGDPRTLDRLLEVLTQKQYSDKMLGADWGPKLEMIRVILKAFVTEFGPLVFLLGGLGLLFMAKTQRVLLIGLALMVLVNIGLRINYIGKDEMFQVLRYMISGFVALLIAAAFYTDRILNSLDDSPLKTGTRKTLSAVLLCGVAALPVIGHQGKNDLSFHRVAYDYTAGILSFPESDYALAVGGDNNVFPIWYLQRFERFGEDVVLIPKQGFRADWLAEEIAARLPSGATEMRIRYADLTLDRRFFSTLDRLIRDDYPVYSLFESTEDIQGQAAMQDLRERFGLTLCGLGLRFGSVPDFCRPDSALWNRYAFDLMIRPDLYRDHHTRDLLGNVSTMLGKRGLALAENDELSLAVQSLKDAALVLPSDPWPLLNLANTLARAGDGASALKIYDDLILREPDNDVFRHNRAIIAAAQKAGEIP